MNKFVLFIVIISVFNTTGICYSATTNDIKELQDELAYYKEVEADQEIHSRTQTDEINAVFISSGIFTTIERAGKDIRAMKEAVMTSAVQLEILLKWKPEKDGKDRDQDVAILSNRNDINKYSTQKELSEAERRGTIKSIIAGIFSFVATGLIFLWKLFMLKKTKRRQSQNIDFEEEILN